MPSVAYDSLSKRYDLLQDESNPRLIATRVSSLISRYGPPGGDGDRGALIVCDLGCGTGSTMLELSRNGYDMIGVDCSAGMLSVAQKAFLREGREALLICQDISHLDLFGTVDVFLSLTDTLNHLTDIRAFRRLFSSMRNFLNPGGLFIFDMLTLHFLSEVRGNHQYQNVEEEYALFWDNRFVKRTAVSRSDMTFFSRNEDETYDRSDFTISERYYSEKQVREVLKLGNLELVGVFGDYRDARPGRSDVRHLYVARRLKEERSI